MSDELRKPAVVDLDALLSPISEETPSGESLRYSGLYDEIAEARRADDGLNQGAWQTEQKVADFQTVIALAVPALTTQSKDLQVAVWLAEALIRVHGLVGLRDSLQLVSGLQDKFWDTLHPEIDEGDMEGRANAVSWLDTQGSFAARSAAFTGYAGYSVNDYEDSKRFDFPDNIESLEGPEQQKLNALREQAERERRVTAEMWKVEVAGTRRAAMEASYFTLEECKAALAELNRVVEEKYDRNQMPGVSTLKKALDDIDGHAKKLLEQKREEEPDEVDADESEASGDGTGTGAEGGKGAGGAVSNRKDALKRLSEIADFFQKTEPHSPVSYLVQRSVKWGQMPLETWLQDVIKDDSILSQLRQTLGFNTGAGDNPENQ